MKIFGLIFPPWNANVLSVARSSTAVETFYAGFAAKPFLPSYYSALRKRKGSIASSPRIENDSKEKPRAIRVQVVQIRC